MYQADWVACEKSLDIKLRSVARHLFNKKRQTVYLPSITSPTMTFGHSDSDKRHANADKRSGVSFTLYLWIKWIKDSNILMRVWQLVSNSFQRISFAESKWGHSFNFRVYCFAILYRLSSLFRLNSIKRPWKSISSDISLTNWVIWQCYVQCLVAKIEYVCLCAFLCVCSKKINKKLC